MDKVTFRITYNPTQKDDMNINEFVVFNSSHTIEYVESEDPEFAEYFGIEIFKNEDLEGEGMCPYKETEDEQKRMSI